MAFKCYQEPKIVSLQHKILRLTEINKQLKKENDFQNHMIFLASLAQGLTLELSCLSPSALCDQAPPAVPSSSFPYIPPTPLL